MDCVSTDCLGILEDGHSKGDGIYWIAPYDMEPFEVYCDMSTDGGGWTLFYDVRDRTDYQFTGYSGWKYPGAGTFYYGEAGEPPYSLHLDDILRGENFISISVTSVVFFWITLYLSN